MSPAIVSPRSSSTSRRLRTRWASPKAWRMNVWRWAFAKFMCITQAAWANRSCAFQPWRRVPPEYEHGHETRRAGEGDGMSKETNVPLEFEGEQLESVF